MKIFSSETKKMVKSFLLTNRRGLSLAVNASLGAFAFVLAFIIRFDFGAIPADYRAKMWMALPLVVGLKLGSIIFFRLTTGLWRYASISDLVRVLKAVLASTIALVLIDVFVWHKFIPRSIYILDYLLTVGFLGGIKLGIRLFRETFRPMRQHSRAGRRTLIIGAGDAGELAFRQFDKEQRGIYLCVGFLDDDPQKQGMSIHGLPILGTVAEAAKITKSLEITEMIIAISGASKSFIRQIVDDCGGHNINFHILPAFKDLITGQFDVDRVRAVNVEDLLGRDPILLDQTRVQQDIGGECVLVTGAGGSIGSELARQIASFKPARLILLDIAESPLFEINRELTERYPNLAIHAAFADIKHGYEVTSVFETFRPTRVYHAAAFKHVPLMEAHPGHAIRNNIMGTQNLAQAAIACGTQRFVMISTDKAVKPSSVMGATKRICERMVLSEVSESTSFAAVRFGNVLGSNGSVIPIFSKQIAAGGPVRVTHPNMTRYFMTIPEAVELVLQAGSIAEAGDTFVLDMGDPVRILDLARRMIELSGMEPDVDIDIKLTGLRPGEKLVEELSDYGEDLKLTEIEKVNVLKRRQNTIRPEILNRAIERLANTALKPDDRECRELLWRIVELDQEVSENAAHPTSREGSDMIIQKWTSILALPDPDEKVQSLVTGKAESTHILVIDDDNRCLAVAKSMLAKLGVDAYTAENLDEALTVLNAESPCNIRAILCDYSLMDTMGDKLMQSIRKAGHDQPFAVITGHTTNDIFDLDFDKLHHFHGILIKPFNRKQLAATLSSMIDHFSE